MSEDVYRKIKKTIKYALVAFMIFVFLFSDPASSFPGFLRENKLVGSFKIFEAKAATQAFYMKITGAVLPYPATSDLFETIAGASSNVASFAQNKKTSGLFQFQPGVTNTAAFGTTPANLPNAPTNKGWIYTGTVLDGMQTDAGNWQVNFKYSVVYTSAPTIKTVWYRVMKVSCSAGICNTVSAISPTDATAPAGSGWSKYALGALPATGVLSAVQTVAFAAPVIDWVSGEEVYAEFAIQTNSTGSTSGGWKLEVGTSSDSLVTANVSVPPLLDAVGFVNNTEGALLDGGRSSHEITVTGTTFGAGPSDGVNNAVKIGTYIVPNGNIISWNATTIVFMIPAAATVYGGMGADGLIIRAGGLDDATPLDFYIYPNITSISANNGQIGSMITVFGDHFGVSAGIAVINAKNALVGTWSETSLADIKIPGQEGAANIAGKIQLTRSDARVSNAYPANPSNFTILAPSVTGLNPISAAAGQTLAITFQGSGIDTDTGIAPILKLTKTGQPDIVGTAYAKITDYQTVNASFDLTGAVTGYWKLVVVNMDGQSGSFGNESTTGFNITPFAPVVTGISPNFGLNTEINKNINSVIGNNFQSGATVKLTQGASTIDQLNVFTYNAGSGNLENGSFNLSGGASGLWDVVVTNPDFQIGICSGCFEIKSSAPSSPTNLSQAKTQAGAAILVGDGIGGQINVYFRMDITGGLTGALNPYTPQVEVKQVGIPFDGLPGSVSSGSDIVYDGITPVLGWVNVSGLSDGVEYHWRARAKNSAGTSAWVAFGGNTDRDPQPSDRDFYIDNTPPVITPGTDGTCNNPGTAAINITDLGATIQWSTDDLTSGAQNPPGNHGPYATAQVEYRLANGFIDWISTPGTLSLENPRDGLALHQVALSGLTPSKSYIYRMISKDSVDNIGYSAVNCTVTTISSQPIKTVEFFIGQEADSYKNLLDGMSKKYFTIILPENPGASIAIKNAFIEITGVSSTAISQTINVGLLRGNQTLGLGPTGENYTLNSDSTVTPVTILFDALGAPGVGQEGMSNITTGATPYDYTLFLKGDGVTDIWLFSAKLIITYSYAQ